MGYAVKCYFDEAASDRIRRIWDDLSTTGLAPFMKESGSRPGISLGVWEEEASFEALDPLTRTFARNQSAISVDSYGIGVFPTDPGAVFAAITPAPELLGFHSAFHKLCGKLSESGSSFYRPGAWVPHSTLAIRCARADIPAITAACLKHDLRFAATLTSIGIVRTLSAEHLCEYPLSAHA